MFPSVVLRGWNVSNLFSTTHEFVRSRGRTDKTLHGTKIDFTIDGREKVLLEVCCSLCSSLFALTAAARQRADRLCGRDRSVLPNNGQPVLGRLCQSALLLGRISPLCIRERNRNDAGRFTTDTVDLDDRCFFSISVFRPSSLWMP